MAEQERAVSRAAELRFRILGPLEFHDGQRWRPVAAAKQRSLLAALLLNADRVVPTDQLINELWGEQIPATAQTLLAGYVWRLRRTLGDSDGRVLVTRPPGYRLASCPGSIDVEEYEALISRARASLSGGSVQQAAEGLNAALALWRGEPLADVPASLNVQAETARLQESRLSAIETYLGIELDLGRHEAILPELRLTISQYPLRERLQAHLMVALYRSGQPAEALGAYRDLRRLLVDELGIEPSKPLQVLERRILSNDLQLLRPAAAASSASPLPDQPSIGLAGQALTSIVTCPAPSPEDADLVVGTQAAIVGVRRLPPDPAVFVGRADAETRLVYAVQNGIRVAVVHGLAGAGKTTLAVRTAYRMARRCPDGQIMIDMRGDSAAEPACATEVIVRLARTLNVALPSGQLDAGAAAGIWQELLMQRRMLIVLDGVASAAQVRDLLPPPAGNAVIITGRSALSTLDGVVRVRLGALSAGEGRAQLRAHLGSEHDEQPAADADAVVRLCDRLPLALRLAAARLLGHPAGSMRRFAEQLVHPRDRLDLLAYDDLSVRVSLRAGVALLERSGRDSAVSCLAALAALDLPVVDTEALGVLWERSTVGAELVAEHLVDAGLVEALSAGCYRVPELTRIFGRELTGPPDDPAGIDAVRRVVDFYRVEAAAQVAALERDPQPGRHDGRMHAWFRQRRATLLLLAARDGADELRRLVTTLAMNLRSIRTPHTPIVVHRQHIGC